MRRRRFPFGGAILGLLLILLITGCGGSVRLVDQFKDRQADGDFAWIADQEVACTPEEEGCNQLHLIKGDACFRLAGQATQTGRDDEAVEHYACAVAELDAGIAQTDDWTVAGGDAAQWYANWCESLRQWRDAAMGATADQRNDQLLAAAQAFGQAVPDHPAATYYRVNAEMASLRPQLLDPEDHPELCDALTALHDDLTAAAAQAEDTAYAASIQQLRNEVETARSAVPGCS